ncbi:hypothetical protein UG55_1010100 [Frankia sp. EI5c]|nr:hypothetical protein UG55_1010100 [Frankia sp. EI5c]
MDKPWQRYRGVKVLPYIEEVRRMTGTGGRPSVRSRPGSGPRTAARPHILSPAGPPLTRTRAGAGRAHPPTGIHPAESLAHPAEGEQE